MTELFPVSGSKRPRLNHYAITDTRIIDPVQLLFRKITVSEYDGNQRLTTITSPEGRQTFSHTDSLGRVIQSSVPGTEAVNYSYDANGFLTQTEKRRIPEKLRFT